MNSCGSQKKPDRVGRYCDRVQKNSVNKAVFRDVFCDVAGYLSETEAETALSLAQPFMNFICSDMVLESGTVLRIMV